MSTMRMKFCLEAARRLSAQDLEQLTEGIEQYMQAGMKAEQAEGAAVDDLAAQVGAERTEMIAMLREQHPTLFTSDRPKLPDRAAQAAAAKKAAQEARHAAREEQRRVYRELSASPNLIGQPLSAVRKLVADALGDVIPELIDQLAKTIHRQLAKNAKELAKQQHRQPEVRTQALADAVTQAFPDASVSVEAHAAFIGGWDHALAGKTKSTLAGEFLPEMMSGYEAAQRWMETEEGAAWYEGRPVNKLTNTGLDLRRWYEQMQEQMKAGESDMTKAWKAIERATTRSDLFATLLPEGVSPGFRLYVEAVRANATTFKQFLDHMQWSGSLAYRGRYSNDKTNLDYILTGERYPYGGEADDGRRFRDDEAFRIAWLQKAAASYLDSMREFIGFLEGKSSVAEAAAAFDEKYVAGKRGAEYLNESGKALVYTTKQWDGNQSQLARLASDSPFTKNLVANEKTIALPTKATPLVPPRMDRVTRDGEDLREGKSVTPQEVKDKFGFADVGFGAWVAAKDDQDHLNYAHDAFVDLATHFGAPVGAIGFNGQMHFTIGALGHGKHAAHFAVGQPSPIGPVEVINLTNTKGDGTVYHEWVHALDHYMGGQWRGGYGSVRSAVLQYLQVGVTSVEEIEAYANRFLFGGSYWSGNKRGDKVDAAITGMRRGIHGKRTAYKTNADALGKDYWGNEQELIARASEAWAADTLGHTNTYLVNPLWVGDGMVTQEKGFRGTPYPTGTERAQFNLIYTALAKAVKWEGGKPTVMLADFEANLPESITAGEKRREELKDRAAMEKYRDDEIARREHEQSEKERLEQEALDKLAAEKLKELEPPVVDSPPAGDTPGALDDGDLEAIFDEAAAELREKASEEPDTPPPGEAPKGDVWPKADLEELLAAIDKGVGVAIGGAGGIPGVPTIHELGAMGKTEHMGFGTFETKGVDEAGKPWSMNWDGGGAMNRTASGIPWTRVHLQGRHPYPSNVAAAIRKAIGAEVEAESPAAAPPETPPETTPPGAADLIKKAADLGVKGADEALKGLSKLFGKPGTLRAFPGGIDEDTYKAALPHFKAALAKFQEAGKTLKDLFKLLISELGDGIKPYALRFAKEENLGANLGPKVSPSMAIAERVKQRLAVGDAFDWRTLFAMADEAYGGTQAEGKYTVKDAYDAMEAGVNRYILAHPELYSPAVTQEDALRAIAALGRITNLLPTQTKRTAEQDEYQQFSTVPALAFAANWVAAIQAGETMAEFSAGIGGLAVFAKNAGATLVLNELSSRRAALLQEVFPDSKVYQENAEQIDNILPADVRPSVVVINPPFSSSAATGVKATSVGAQHVKQALRRLAPGGRLVAIVGEGMAMDKPAFAGWWRDLQKDYDVRAAVPMDGSGYAKYGTSFNNVLLVIDKRPPSGNAIVTTPVKEYSELIGLLAKVRNERPNSRAPVDADRPPEQDTSVDTRNPAPAPGGGEPVAAPPGAGPTTGLGAGTPPGGPGLASGGRGGRGGGGTGRPGRPGGRPGPGGRDTDADRGGATTPAADSGPDTTGDTSGVTIAGATEKAGELTDTVFEGYVPQRLQIPGAKPHPGPLVQSAAMASVLPPAPTYTPNLPAATITEGKLSIAQLETTVYAGQAHAQLLDMRSDPGTLHTMRLDNKGVPEMPYRRGYFIGDGTGVGKGREIAGIIIDNLRQGRTKHVWVSEKQGLLEDAKRDFEGAGGDPKQLFNQQPHNTMQPIPKAGGVVFTTYATLRSLAKNVLQGGFTKGDKVKVGRAFGPPGSPDYDNTKLVKIDRDKHTVTVEWPGGTVIVHPFAQILAIANDTHWLDKVHDKNIGPRSRVDQLVEWLGPTFDGVIAFDEAHNAGNAVPIRGDRGTNPPSQQAAAMVELQNRLPNARVVYVSATGATEVSNLAYASRLGAWGIGTPFADIHNFIAEMVSGGLATMELVARDLKQVGSYIARSLSYEGVRYSRVEHELTDLQHDIYNRLCDAWQVTLQNFMEALHATGAISATGATKNSNAVKNAKSIYWGAQQRFFNQIITSMQMPTVMEAVDRDLAAGNAVVLQLVNTNEAQQERSLARIEEDSGDLEDLDLTPRDQLLEMVRKAFPVQQYQDVLDPNTGKMITVPVFDSEGNPVENRQMVAKRDQLLKDLEEIRVPDGPLELILNQYGVDVVAEITGRKQRVVPLPDADGNLTKQVQKRSDSHVRADATAFMADRKRILVFSDAGGTGYSFHADRTKANQRQRSHYLIQPGWRANKAVQGLGRTHRTNQASAPHYVLASTNIPGHKRFLSSIARRLDQLGALTKGQRDTSSGGLFSEKDNLESIYAQRASRALIDDAKNGQVPGLVFNDFLRQMGLENIVNQQTGNIAESAYPETRQFLNRMLSLKLEMQDLVFEAFITRMEEQVELAAQRGELDTGMQTIRALEAKVDRDEVVHTDERTGAETRYVELTLTHPTRMYPFPANDRLPIEWVRNVKSGRVWAKIPSGRTTKRDGSIVDRYRMMGTGGTQIKEAPDFADPKAYAALTEAEAHVLWDQETAARPQTYTDKAHMIVGAMLPIWDRLKTAGVMQVARTQTTDGERLLGRLLRPNEVADILKRLDVDSSESKLPAKDVLARIIKGEVAELANGWRLARSRVSDELRVEIIAKNMQMAQARELMTLGAQHERISWNDRYFVPNAEVLERILKTKPLVSLTNPNQGSTNLDLEVTHEPIAAPEVIESGPVPQDHVDAVAALERRFDDVLGGLQLTALPMIPKPAAGDSPLTMQRYAAQEWLPRLYGTKVVYFAANQPFAHGMQADDMPGMIFINEATNRPVMAVMGHEMLHVMRKTNPELYARLAERLEPFLRDPQSYEAKLSANRAARGLPPLAQHKLREELYGDIVGDNWEDPAFWRRVTEGQPSMFRRVLRSIADFLDDLISKLRNQRPYGTQRYLTDVKAARDVVAEVMREFSALHAEKRGDTTVMADTRFADTVVAASEGTPILYSALARQIGTAPMKQGKAQAWLDFIKGLVAKGAVKAEEVEWSGVNDWLKFKSEDPAAAQALREMLGESMTQAEKDEIPALKTSDKITQAEVMTYLHANGVQISETIYGGDDPEETGPVIAQAELDRLGHEYNAWTADEGLPQVSMDELARADLTPAQRAQLTVYEAQWDEANGGLPAGPELIVELDAAGFDIQKDWDGKLTYVTRREDGVAFQYDPEAGKWHDALDESANAEGAKILDPATSILATAVGTALEQEQNNGPHGWQAVEADPETRFEGYKVKGGTNYREIVFVLSPGPEPSFELDDYIDEMNEKYGRREVAPNHFEPGWTVQDLTPQEAATLTNLQRRNKAERQARATAETFQSSHWNMPNVVAHIRVTDRFDAEGRRVLFIEEIQSDWAQKGKKHGFKVKADAIREAGEKVRAADDALHEQMDAITQRLQGKVRGHSRGTNLQPGHFYELAAHAYDLLPPAVWYDHAQHALIRELVPREMAQAAVDGWNAWRAAQDELRALQNTSSIPPGPFVQVTESWVRLAVKRAIKLAVDEGHDLVAFANGEQSADHYDLSKAVEQISWAAGENQRRGPTSVGRIDVAHAAVQWADAYRNILIQLVHTPPGTGIQLGINDKGVIERTAGRGSDVYKDKELEEVIGKEIAQKIMADEKGKLRGAGLTIGGEGMKAFYDKIVPNVTNDVLKKLGGGKVRMLQIENQRPWEFHEKSRYVGPIPTYQEMNSLYQLASGYPYGRNVDTSPFTGKKLSGTLDRVNVEYEVGRIAKAMHAGVPFERVITAEGSPFLLEVLGGKLEPIPEAERPVRPPLQQLGFEVTPKMEELAAGGLPMFSLPQFDDEQKRFFAKGGIDIRTRLQRSADRVRTSYGNAIDALRSDWARRFQQGYIDQFSGWKHVEDSLFGKMIADVSPYVAMRLANGAVSSVIRGLLMHGQARWAANGQHLEKIPGTIGLLDILKPVSNEVNAWFGWMIAVRAQRLIGEGKEKNFDQTDIDAGLRLLTPENEVRFKKAALQFAAFKRSVLDIAEEAGLIDAEDRKVWDLADWIPFYRKVDETVMFGATGKFVRGPYQKKGLQGQSSGIRRLFGGEAPLNDPIENVIMNFTRLIDASLKNSAIVKAIDLVEDEGDLVKKVGYTASRESIPLHQVRAELELHGTPATVLDAIPEEAFQGMARMWAIQAPTEPDVVRIMRGGKAQFYKVNDQLMLRSLTSFVPFDFPGLGVARAFKRTLTASVTANPVFMVRNFIRDWITTLMVARGKNLNIGEAFEGIYKSYRETGLAENALFAGASFQSGQINAGDPTGTGRAVRRALRRKGFRGMRNDAAGILLDTPARWWEHYRHAGEAVENANREALASATLASGGSMTSAMFEFKDSLDFTLRGSSPVYNIMADTLPFLNARNQGMYRLARSDPKLFTRKFLTTRVVQYGILMSLMALALGWINHDNPDYDALEDWDKDNYWHFWIIGRGGKRVHLKVTKPFELGVLFATIPERLQRNYFGQDSNKETVSRIYAAIRDQLAVDPVPQVVRPLLSAYANKDPFRNRPIENARDADLPASERFNERTSATARRLVGAIAPVADAIELSPKKLEYLVNGYLGAVGTFVLGMSDMAVRYAEGAPARPTTRLDDLPLVSSFYEEDPRYSTVFESQLFELRRIADGAVKAVKGNVDRDREDRAIALQKRFEPEIGVHKAVDKAAGAITKLNRLQDVIYADRTMTPDEKRKQIDEILKAKADIARGIMKEPEIRATQ